MNKLVNMVKLKHTNVNKYNGEQTGKVIACNVKNRVEKHQLFLLAADTCTCSVR